MRETEAIRTARQFDLTVKAGIYFKARKSASNDEWHVVRVNSETDRERVWRR